MVISKFRPLKLAAGAALALCMVAIAPAHAWDCTALPSYQALKEALIGAQKQGSDRGAQWPGSRMISAQKAYTANAFSLPGLALSTANLYYAVQPGGSLYGLQASNPVDPALAYLGPASNFGTAADPMVGYRVGGVNVFGGGLALYNKSGELIGAIGVSGDSSCADHNIAWRTRHRLALDYVPAGVSGDPTRPDNIVFDLTPQTGQQSGLSVSGWGHPLCGVTTSEKAIAAALPVKE